MKIPLATMSWMLPVAQAAGLHIQLNYKPIKHLVALWVSAY
jgi:hypothetical protein